MRQMEFKHFNVSRAYEEGSAEISVIGLNEENLILLDKLMDEFSKWLVDKTSSKSTQSQEGNQESKT